MDCSIDSTIKEFVDKHCSKDSLRLETDAWANTQKIYLYDKPIIKHVYGYTFFSIEGSVASVSHLFEMLGLLNAVLSHRHERLIYRKGAKLYWKDNETFKLEGWNKVL